MCYTKSREKGLFMRSRVREAERDGVLFFFRKIEKKEKKKANEGKTLRGMLVSPGSVLGF